jgi:dehydrodolichyl diphosphate syntase complex subunit NUS1
VNLYSSEDAPAKFDELLMQELCNESTGSAICKSKKITIDYIDEKLRKLYGEINDPDLAVYFGNTCCTMGFMPWQIRLTEFVPISYKIQSLSLEKYLRVLYKYAKCEQRFGK